MLTTVVVATVLTLGQGSPIELAKKGLRESAEIAKKANVAQMLALNGLATANLSKAEAYLQKAGFDLDKTKAQAKDIVGRLAKVKPTNNADGTRVRVSEEIEAAKLCGNFLDGLNKVAPDWHKGLGTPIASAIGTQLYYTPTGAWTNPQLPDKPDEKPSEVSTPPAVILPLRPDPYNQWLTGPYEAGTSDPGVVNNLGPHVDVRNGNMYVEMSAYFINAQYMTASILQTFHTPRDARLVRAEVNFSPGEAWWDIAMVNFGGYGSAEGIVSLRIMDGSTIVAEDRRSLIRLVTSVFGVQHVNGGPRPALRLACNWTRPDVGLEGTYTVVVVYEALAGAAGETIVSNWGGVRVPGFQIRCLR